jgi:siroheme synthase-like protein
MEFRPVYPVALLAAGRACLVVGGGQIAHRKALGLLEAGADVTVVAPEVAAELAALPLRIERRTYLPGEAAGYWLVCTATGDEPTDRAVFADAERAGILVNAADDPAHCSYLLPANHRVGPVTISVSTAGASPGLAVWLRDRVAAQLDVDVARLADLATYARSAIRSAGRASEGLPWNRLFDELAVALQQGATAEADDLAARFVAAAVGGPAAPRGGSDPAPG